MVTREWLFFVYRDFGFILLLYELIFFSRLCLKYEAYAGGYIKLETKIYHYGTTAAKKTLCYFYDDQAPLHCSDIGTCSFAPLQLSVDITNTSTIFVSFPGWEDVDFAGTASIFASGISHFKINLCEMEYNNGILNMKHICKTSKTCCHTCSSVVIDLPQTYESKVKLTKIIFGWQHQHLQGQPIFGNIITPSSVFIGHTHIFVKCAHFG